LLVHGHAGECNAIGCDNIVFVIAAAAAAAAAAAMAAAAAK